MKYDTYFIDGATVLEVKNHKRISNTGEVGIHKIKNSNRYVVSLGKKTLGWRPTLEAAVALRDEGRARKADGTFEDWWTSILAGRRHTK